jgi:hypothetical protein
MRVTLSGADTIGTVSALEISYTSLLAGTVVVTTWFAVYVVYRLYQGQR